MARESAALADQGRTDALRGHVAALKDAAVKAAVETPPADILNPIPVRLYQDDLRHDASQLGDIATMDDDGLREALRILTGAIEATLEQAKMDILEHPALGPNHGLVSPFFDTEGKLSGFLEIILHGNAHLECRLFGDRACDEPFGVPAGTALKATFLDHANRFIALESHGADEPFHAAPADADWLTGEAFRSKATVEFSVGDKPYTSPPFLLIPLAHEQAHTCAH